MIYYTMPDRFKTAILKGLKVGHITKHRKRHTVAGDTVQLANGGHQKLNWGETVITKTGDLEINFARDTVKISWDRDPKLPPLPPMTAESSITGIGRKDGLDMFARQQGFANWTDLKEFHLPRAGAIEEDLHGDHVGVGLVGWQIILWDHVRLLPPPPAKRVFTPAPD